MADGTVRLTDDEVDDLRHELARWFKAENRVEAMLARNVIPAVERIIESRVDAALVEGANIGIYMRRDALTARQSDPDATERVEWGVRWNTGAPDMAYADEASARRTHAEIPDYAVAVLRRTVTTGEWTEVGE